MINDIRKYIYLYFVYLFSSIFKLELNFQYAKVLILSKGKGMKQNVKIPTAVFNATLGAPSAGKNNICSGSTIFFRQVFF